MNIFISGSNKNQCYKFKEYLLDNINKDLNISIFNEYKNQKIKDPHKLDFYNYNLHTMYAIICSDTYNSFLQATRERIHRLNIIKYIYIVLLRKFYKNNSDTFLKLYSLLLKGLIIRYIAKDKLISFFKTKIYPQGYHFHLGCMTTDVELQTCIKSKYIHKNKLIYAHFNWDYINSKAFIPKNLFEHIMSWDPIITENYPRFLIGKTTINFTSSFRLENSNKFDITKKEKKIIFFGSQKDIHHEIKQVCNIKNVIKEINPEYKFIYRPHPYALETIVKYFKDNRDISTLESPIIVNVNSKSNINNESIKIDYTPLEELLITSKISIAPGSTTLLESSLYGCASILLCTNPSQVTLKLMYQKDHILSLLTLPGTELCPSILIAKIKLRDLITKGIDHELIRSKSLDLYKPYLFKNSLKDLLKSY